MRRSLRIARLGIRGASTAAKVKPSWTQELVCPSTAPQSRSWARPSDASPPPLTTPRTRNWDRPQATSPSDIPPRRSWARPPTQSSPSSRPGLSELPETIRTRGTRDRRSRDNQVNREEPPHNRADRDAPPHLRTSKRDTPGRNSTDRDAAPLTRLGHILGNERFDRAGKGKEQTSPAASEKTARTLSDADSWISVDDVVDEEQDSRQRRRTQFKERGSLLSRIADEHEDPKRSRGASDHGLNGKEKEKEKLKTRKAAKTVKPVNVDVYIPSVVTVGALAKLLNVRFDTLRRKMVRVGMEAEAAPTHMLSSEYSSLLALEFNRNPVVNDEAAFDIYPPSPHLEPSTLPERPPVVTIMGHVDHGKTTLLDTLRSTSVAKGEAGGITQHIGAFSVPVPASSGSSEEHRTITFLDTPGHAAFSAMRARGASVTDIVVLVVAADDGIMPQTREVLELVKNSSVGLVVAINKVDKPEADISKVEHALLSEGVQLETFGGDIPSVPVSGLTGQGLDQLVETISVLAEMQDLRAEKEGPVHGYVLESKMTKGLGPTGTVLVLRGDLKPGQHLICGKTSAKIRILTDSNGKSVKVAHPGMAVIVSGWKELPNAGDEVLSGTEADIKKALTNRVRKSEMEATLVNMEAVNEQRRIEREMRELEETQADSSARPQEAGPKELRLVIKGDVSGSVEAVVNALEVIGNDVARTKIVATGVGDVNESDVMRAKASEGIVVAFSVKTSRPIEAIANAQNVPVLSSSVIYKLMDAVTERVAALLPPIVETRVSGEATVIQLFDIQLRGKRTTQVGGCRVASGVVEKNKLARVMRDGEIIYQGKLDTLRQHKSDVQEVSKGVECGLNLADFNDLRAGDVIQMYEEVFLPGKL